MENKQPKYKPPIHSFPIYGLIVCGAICIFVGFYFQLNNIKISGNDGENEFGINGIGAIGLGIAILIFPIYTLIKQGKEKRSFDRNIF